MSSQLISKVAIVGATGRVGGAFAKALVRTGKHEVIALMRAESKGKLCDGVVAVDADYDDETTLVNALKGQQFLIITLPAMATADLHGKIVTAAGKAGIPYIMPNAYGYPLKPEDVKEGDAYSASVIGRIREIQNNGVSSSVTLNCGFWYEWSLALGEFSFGVNVVDRKATFFDDGKRTIAVSTWDQCGNALAGLLSLPEHGESPCLADFKNKTVLVNSFRVSQRDMLDSLHRGLGTTDEDWDITYETTAQRIKEGAEEMKKGNRAGFGKMLYGRVFLADNKNSDYADTGLIHNQMLGLPKEDLDEVTKKVAAMVEGGWDPRVGSSRDSINA